MTTRNAEMPKSVLPLKAGDKGFVPTPFPTGRNAVLPSNSPPPNMSLESLQESSKSRVLVQELEVSEEILQDGQNKNGSGTNGAKPPMISSTKAPSRLQAQAGKRGKVAKAQLEKMAEDQKVDPDKKLVDDKITKFVDQIIQDLNAWLDNPKTVVGSEYTPSYDALPDKILTPVAVMEKFIKIEWPAVVKMEGDTLKISTTL